MKKKNKAQRALPFKATPTLKPTPQLPPTGGRFRELVSLAIKDGQDVAADVILLAEKYGMAVRDVVNHPEILACEGLTTADVTAKVMGQARGIERAYTSSLDDYVRQWNARIPEPADLFLPTTTTAREAETSKRSKLFGHPVTAVIRWMGAEDWTFAEAKRALDALHINVADATITAQLRAGKLGQRGDPANLTEEQANTLYDKAS